MVHQQWVRTIWVYHFVNYLKYHLHALGNDQALLVSGTLFRTLPIVDPQLVTERGLLFCRFCTPLLYNAGITLITTTAHLITTAVISYRHQSPGKVMLRTMVALFLVSDCHSKRHLTAETWQQLRSYQVNINQQVHRNRLAFISTWLYSQRTSGSYGVKICCQHLTPDFPVRSVNYITTMQQTVLRFFHLWNGEGSQRVDLNNLVVAFRHHWSLSFAG